MGQIGRMMRCLAVVAAFPMYSQGLVFQAGVLRSTSQSADSWNGEQATRAFLSMAQERDLGPGWPILSLSLGFLSGMSRHAAKVQCSCTTNTYVQGAEGTLGLLLSSPGRWRFGGGLEGRFGKGELRTEEAGGPVRSETKLRSDTWLLGFTEADLGKGFSLIGRVGMSRATAPRPSREVSLALRYRP